MRGRLLLTAILAAAAAALGGALVAIAAADDAGALPDIAAPELIARMGDHSRAPDAISGDIRWINRLFGDLPAAPEHAGLPAESPLLASGSGRLWTQDGKLRLESQGSGGDQVLVADAPAGTVWTYTFATDTAHLYEAAPRGRAGDAGPRDDASGGPPQGGVPSDRSPRGDASCLPASPGTLTPERVSGFLRAAARLMAVDVTGTTVVAGRDAYLLTMTPAATDTALGKIEAAVDGETYVPLRLDVVARGSGAPTLSFGFTRVSYDPVDESVFAFTPPEGAKVERDTVGARIAGDGIGATKARPAGEARPPGEGGAPSSSRSVRADAVKRVKDLARGAFLTREEAAGLLDFRLAWARDYTARDFRWAHVLDGGMPLNALGAPVFDLAGMAGTFGAASSGGDASVGGAAVAAGGTAAGASPPEVGPAAVLVYGEGFGSIVLAETKATGDLRQRLEQLPAIVDHVDLGGTWAQAVVTPLGGVAIWERDGVTLVAGGMVSRADLVDFVTSVR